jgi:hypothetical protein
MADNSQNNELASSKELSKSLKSSIKDQGDYNDLVANSVSSLQRLNRELEKQNSNISDSVSGQLTFKKLSDQILEAKKKEKIAQQNLNDLSKTINDQSRANAESLVNNINKKIKAEQLYHAAVRSGNKNQIQAADKLISDLENTISLQEKSLNVEELQYSAALKIAQARKQGVKDAKEQLTLGTKLKAYGEVGSPLAKGALGAITGKGEGFGSLIDKSIDMLKMIPGIGGAIGGLLGGMKSLFDFIVEIEDRTVKFGRNLGYSREQSFAIANQFANIATSSGKLLLTSENLMEVQTDLSQQLGVNNILSAEMLSTQIELKKVMGLTADEMGELAKTSIISGQNQKQVVTGVLSQVAGLKAATGISFNYKQIIGEVTKLSGVLGLQFAKYPEKLTKSLLVTKALGMDLGKVDQIAGSLLNFESAIQNQLEAQLITGKDINLSTAQQLALQGDTAGVAMELTKQFGSASEFLAMNRIQQEAIAKAVGMERNELADVLKNQDMLTKLGAKDTDNNQRKLELALQQYKTQENINKALGEGAYENLTQLSAQEKMAALIDKVKGALQDFLTKSGVVEWITGLINKLSNPDNVKGLVNMLKEGAAFIADAVQGAALGILKIADIFTDIDPDLIERLEGTSAGDKIRSLGGSANSAEVKDFVIKPMGEDTITMAGGTKLGRTDEMVDLLKQLLNETRQGKTMSLNIDGAPIAAAVAKNAPMNYAASNLGPRPLR